MSENSSPERLYLGWRKLSKVVGCWIPFSRAPLWTAFRHMKLIKNLLWLCVKIGCS